MKKGKNRLRDSLSAYLRSRGVPDNSEFIDGICDWMEAWLSGDGSTDIDKFITALRENYPVEYLDDVWTSSLDQVMPNEEENVKQDNVKQDMTEPDQDESERMKGILKDRLQASTTGPTTHASLDAVERLREAAMIYGNMVIDFSPNGRELSLTLTHLEESLMWAIRAMVSR